MPQLSKSTKKVPPHTREEGRVPVEGYTARNPSFFKRKTIQYTNRPAQVIKQDDGQTLIRLPQTDYNQVVMGIKHPMDAFRENGVEDWELPQGQVLVGNFKNRSKVPIQLSQRREINEEV